MPNTYHPAPDVRRMAQGIISEHHSHLITNQVYVKFLFCEEPEKVKGREALGTARKESGLNAYLALCDDPDVPRSAAFAGDGKPLVEEFFLIIIWRDFWKSRDTTDHQRRALVDHELSHLWSEEQVDKDGHPTGKILLSLLPHDLEEFDRIVSRYGAWQPDIEAFAKALRSAQPGLFDDMERADAPSLFDAGLLAPGEAEMTLTVTHNGRSVSLPPLSHREVEAVLNDVAQGRAN